MKKSNYILLSLLTMILIKLITAPTLCVNYALLGANLFFYKVFPSLFPFIVLCNLIISFNGIEIYSHITGNLLTKPFRISKRCSLVLIISMLCGYPLGAKYSAQLLGRGEIDEDSYNKLINIASSPSPFFVIIAVGYSMLGNINYGYILILSCYLSCFIMGLIIKGRGREKYFPKKVYENKNMGEVLGDSINNASSSVIVVLSYVVLFSVVIGIIKNSSVINTAVILISNTTKIDKNIILGLFSGLIELTNGCSIIAALKISMDIKLMLLSFILSFSSLSVILQANSFIYKTKFPLGKYIERKFIQGLISVIVVLCLTRFVPFLF